MPLSFMQTDAAAICGQASFCSARTNNGWALQALVGGTPGTAKSDAVGASAANVIQIWWELPIASGTSWAAGNWTVRVNVTVANANITITEVYVCQVSAACASVSSIGSLTGQSVSLGTTGVKSFTVSGSAVAAPSAGDKVVVLVVASNSAASIQSFSFDNAQLIDTPFLVSYFVDGPFTRITFEPSTTALPGANGGGVFVPLSPMGVPDDPVLHVGASSLVAVRPGAGGASGGSAGPTLQVADDPFTKISVASTVTVLPGTSGGAILPVVVSGLGIADDPYWRVSLGPSPFVLVGVGGANANLAPGIFTQLVDDPVTRVTVAATLLALPGTSEGSNVPVSVAAFVTEDEFRTMRVARSAIIQVRPSPRDRDSTSTYFVMADDTPLVTGQTTFVRVAEVLAQEVLPMPPVVLTQLLDDPWVRVAIASSAVVLPGGSGGGASGVSGVAFVADDPYQLTVVRTPAIRRPPRDLDAVIVPVAAVVALSDDEFRTVRWAPMVRAWPGVGGAEAGLGPVVVVSLIDDEVRRQIRRFPWGVRAVAQFAVGDWIGVIIQGSGPTDLQEWGWHLPGTTGGR